MEDFGLLHSSDAGRTYSARCHQPIFDWSDHDQNPSTASNSDGQMLFPRETNFAIGSNIIDFNSQPDIYSGSQSVRSATFNRNESFSSTQDLNRNSPFPRLEITGQDNAIDRERQADFRQMIQAIEPYLEALVFVLTEISRQLALAYQFNTGGGASRNVNGRDGKDGPSRSPDKDSGSKSSDNSGSSGDSKTDSKNDNDSNSSNSSRFADTGVTRGRTIFRDDFNGKKGERPNSEVYDTAHIGGDGKTRQRGVSNKEDGIISTRNTLLDGDGNLQLFPERKRVYDDVANEYVNYTKGSFNTTDGLHFNLKDHPEGVVVEVRAKHPTRDGAKFNALWIMTEHWAADASKGQKQGDTVEYDAAEGGGAEITVHHPTKSTAGKYQDHRVGGARIPGVDFEDGKFHTYTVVITPNDKTGKGDVVQYVDGKRVFSHEGVFPKDKDLHLRSSLEISPAWTHKTLTGPGGMNSDAAGVIDYIDISELAQSKR